MGSAADLSDWYEGPVRYLMNRTETKVYRKLRTEEERLAFIRRFWDRRDPNPTTPENEARLVFWHRVAEANREYGDTPAPGWKTDRGKIYILLGPPDDVQRNYEFDTQSNSGNRGLLRWFYTGVQRSANRAVSVIAFVRTGGYDWRLTTDPRLSSIYLNVYDPYTGLNDSSLVGLGRLSLDIPYGEGSLATAMDLARLQEVPTERQLMRAAVNAEQYLGTMEATGSIHRLQGAQGPLYAVTVGMETHELSPPWDGSPLSASQRFVVTGQLRNADDPSQIIEIPETSFSVQPIAGSSQLRFQALRELPPPGLWKLSAIVLDRSGGGAAVLRRQMEVAAANPAAPIVTGPILAEVLTNVPDGQASSGVSVPFRVGNRVVVPLTEPTVSHQDELKILLDVQPAEDITTATPLSWHFESIQPDGSSTPFESPGQLKDGRGTRAWSIPAKRFPVGRYRLVIEAGGESNKVTRSLEFRVLDEDPKKDLDELMRWRQEQRERLLELDGG